MIIIKSKLFKIIIIAIFIVGIAVLLFPYVARIITSHSQQLAIRSYMDNTELADDEDIKIRTDEAKKYNEDILNHSINIPSEYSNALNIGSDNIISVVEIPKINVKLPVYGGTDDKDLEKGAGHIEGTSLPVGGKSTHCCISAHRGLAYSVMFRDLDSLALGDKFYIYTLDKKLEYTVDNISTVTPDDISSLNVEKDRDYVTLITCTPYMINTHRILVRGTRTA